MNEVMRGVPKPFIELIDQVFEIERKAELLQVPNSIARNINKMKEIFESIFAGYSESGKGLSYHNPMGEPYNDTRTDLEASIAGNSSENLFVSEVIKPIIRYRNGNITMILRKGVVVVESKK